MRWNGQSRKPRCVEDISPMKLKSGLLDRLSRGVLNYMKDLNGMRNMADVIDIGLIY